MSVQLDKIGYPARSPALRQTLARRGICPNCGSVLEKLDKAGVIDIRRCTDCAYNATRDAKP